MSVLVSVSVSVSVPWNSSDNEAARNEAKSQFDRAKAQRTIRHNIDLVITGDALPSQSLASTEKKV